MKKEFKKKVTMPDPTLTQLALSVTSSVSDLTQQKLQAQLIDALAKRKLDKKQ